VRTLATCIGHLKPRQVPFVISLMSNDGGFPRHVR
jgi:hypothetical protein